MGETGRSDRGTGLGPLAYRFRAELRDRWRAWLGVALVAGLASGAVMGLAAGARRTDSAHARFLVAHDAYDVLVVNYPDDGTAVFDFDELEALPQVLDSARAAFDYVTFDAGNLASYDGRIGTEINRFKLLEGRLADPEAPAEIVVGFALAEAHGLGIGDTVDLLPADLLAWAQAPDEVENPFPELGPDFFELFTEIIEELPGGTLTIVGIVAAPGELPPQFQLNRHLVHLTPALARLGVIEPGKEALMLRLRGGASAVDGFLLELERRSGGLPPQVILQREHAAAVDRSIGLQARALWLLAGLTALAGALIVGQLLGRLARLESADEPTLSALGMSQHDRFAISLGRAGVIGLVGAASGTGAAVLSSPLFPTGLARLAEPRPGFAVDATVLLAGSLATVVMAVALTWWPAWRVSRDPGAVEGGATSGRPTRALRAVTALGAPITATTGIRMALEPGRGRTAVPVRSTLGGVTLGIVAVTAALSIGASLGHLLDSPRLYGLTYDLEVMGPWHDAGLVVREGVDLLLDDERVEALAVGGVVGGPQLEVEGRRFNAVVAEAIRGDAVPPVVSGRAPTAPDEIALGARTLRSLGVAIGERVDVAVSGTGGAATPMRVVGTVVLPAVSEGAQLGHGALLAPSGAEALQPGGIDLAALVRLAPGADEETLISDLDRALGLERPEFGEAVFVFHGDDPTDIVNFGRVEATPFLVGGTLAAIAGAMLVHLLLSAVRRRRHDIAILKALGFVRGQVTRSVAWQATTVALIGALVGTPIGVALGRWVWTLLAGSLGVLVEPRAPIAASAAVAAVALLLANLIALLPARLAARTRPGEVLRAG